MNLYQLVESGLATWRISHMLVYEAGPFDIFIKIRSKFGVVHDENDTPIGWPHGSVFECVWCLSVWIAAIMTLGLMPKVLQRTLAISAVAALVENNGIRNNEN